ncbi:MAG: enoyl-CoA hydratase/isomerase family protein [Promethearchaeota archaeon]
MSDTPEPAGASEKLIVSVKRKVATIELNRPDCLHALDFEVLKGLGDKIEELAANPKVRAIIIGTTGGRAFSAGLDTKWLVSGENVLDKVLTYGTRLSTLVHTVPVPVICRINGIATGWGFILSMCADFRIVADSPEVFFQLPEFNVNLFPATGAAYFAILNFGLAKAKEIIMTTRRYSIADMQNLGWITELVPAGELEERTFKFAVKLTKFSQVLVSLTKAAMNVEGDTMTKALLGLEEDCVAFIGKSPKFEETRQFVKELYDKWMK